MTLFAQADSLRTICMSPLMSSRRMDVFRLGRILYRMRFCVDWVCIERSVDHLGGYRELEVTGASGVNTASRDARAEKGTLVSSEMVEGHKMFEVVAATSLGFSVVPVVVRELGGKRLGNSLDLGYQINISTLRVGRLKATCVRKYSWEYHLENLSLLLYAAASTYVYKLSCM